MLNIHFTLSFAQIFPNNFPTQIFKMLFISIIKSSWFSHCNFLHYITNNVYNNKLHLFKTYISSRKCKPKNYEIKGYLMQ